MKRDLLPFNLTVLARDSSSTGHIMETGVPVIVSTFNDVISGVPLRWHKNLTSYVPVGEEHVQ